MAKLDEKLIALCDWIENATALTTLISKRTMTPQTHSDFITVNWGSLTPVANDRVDLIDQKNLEVETMTERVRGLFFAEVIIQGFGKNAFSALERLVKQFRTSGFFYFCEVNQFGFSGEVSFQDISATLLDSNYERRGEIKTSFYVVATEDFDADYFLSENISIQRQDIKEV